MTLYSVTIRLRSGPEVIKLFSCSTQLSMEFQLLIKSKMLKKKILAFKLSDVVCTMLINVKMPTIVTQYIMMKIYCTTFDKNVGFGICTH